MSEEPASLAKRLARLRQAAGFANQRHLAKASGVRQSTIADIESGRTTSPRADTLERLAQALDRPVEELLPGTVWPWPSQVAYTDKFRKLPYARQGEIKGSLIAERVAADALNLPEPEMRHGPCHVLIQVVEASASSLDIRVGDVLTLDLGGVIGLDHLVAYVAREEPEPFKTFHIRWRIGAQSNRWIARPTKRIGILGGKDPFTSIIDEARGDFRAVGPVLDLRRSYPTPAT